MRILIGLAAGMLATTALAQTTTTTNSTTSMGTMPMPDKMMNTTSTTATHESKSMHSTTAGHHRMSGKRHCHTMMKHGKKTRMCHASHMKKM